MTMSDLITTVPSPTERDPRWAAVLARSAEADGTFYYSVRTTGVYCRPSCASRRARPENVRFHTTREAAEQAGFRACKRCKPDQPSLAEQHAALVTEACRLIETAPAVPSLDRLATEAGLSPFHFHRVFKAITGLTPRALRRGTSRGAGSPGARAHADGHRRHLRVGLQLQRPVLRRVGADARHDAIRLSRRRRERRDPLRGGRMLVGLDPGRPERPRGVRHLSWATTPTPSRASCRIASRVPRSSVATPSSRRPWRRSSGSSNRLGSVSICRSTCKAPPFSSGSGRRSARSPPAGRRATPRSRVASARPGRCARWRTPVPPIISRSRSPATAWCATTADSRAIAGESSGSGRCWSARRLA